MPDELAEALGLSDEDVAECAAWDADAYKIVVEVPRSKITAEQLDNLFFRIGQTVDVWAEAIEERDWDPFLYGHGPMHAGEAP